MTIVQRFRQNWFYLLLPVALLTMWNVASTPQPSAGPRLLEAVLLFDCLVSMPVLYFLFLRRSQSVRAALLRAGLLSCGMLAFAAWSMPEGEGVILPHLVWLRAVVLPLVIIVEGIALVAVTRHAFGKAPDPQKLAEMGMPPLLARMMIAEARFWKKVWKSMTNSED